MALWDLIKSIRESAGKDGKPMSREEFAEKVKCTAMHVSLMERPISETRRTASEQQLRRIAESFSKNERDRIRLERMLLFEKALITSPPEIASFLEEKRECFESMGSMAVAFIKRLKRDLAKVKDGKPVVLSTMKNGEMAVHQVLKGACMLPRRAVVELAKVLEQPIDEYLELAGYAPREEEPSESMPKPFIEKLRGDIEKAHNGRAKVEDLSTVKNAAHVIDKVLKGQHILSRPSVIEVAVKLGQSPEQYLLLAGYIPDEMQRLVKHERMLTLSRSAEDLKPQEFDKLMDLIMDGLKLLEMPKTRR